MGDAPFEWSEAFFPSGDGTELHADVLRPASMDSGTRTPVLLHVTPYGNHAGQLPQPNQDASGPSTKWAPLWQLTGLFDRGYTWVSVDLRGTGGSSGCLDSGGDGEQADVRAAVEWCAAQSWSTGRVALFGMSYDGWSVLMGLAEAPRGLVAAVTISPLQSAYSTLYMNGVPYHYLVNAAATAVTLNCAPPSRNDQPRYQQSVLRRVAENAGRYAELIGDLVTRPDQDDPFWKERDLVERAARSTVPVLWSHGFWDAECHADNILPIFSQLRGPKVGWFGHWAHEPALMPELVGKPGFSEEMMRWLDHYLLGSPPEPGVGESSVVVQDNRGVWRTEREWPPHDVVWSQLTLVPGSFVDQAGNGAHAKGLTGRTGVGAWSIGPKLPHDVHLAGPPSLEVTVKCSAARGHVFAIVYDIDTNGTARVVTRGAHVVRGNDTILFDLFPTDWRFHAGHRIGVLLAGAEDVYWLPPHSGATVDVIEGTLRLPCLGKEPVFLAEGGPSRLLKDPPPHFQLSAEVLEQAPTTFQLPTSLS